MTRLIIQCVLILVFAIAARHTFSQIGEAYSRYGTPIDIVAEQLQPRKGPEATSVARDATPLSAFAQTSAKPVFFEGRQYPTKAEPKNVAVALPPPVRALDTTALKLRGIIKTGGIAKAFIEINPNAPAWLNVGDTVEGWKLQSIGNNSVGLINGAQAASLELYQTVHR